MVTRRNALKLTAGGICSVLLSSTEGFCGQEQRQAMFWNAEGAAVRCTLCPHNCLLKEGATGICRTRKNVNGIMKCLGYGHPCAVHVDPIEKKPLYHVLPGAKAYSIAIAGCNFRCKNCQNYTISQASPLETPNYDLSPQHVVDEALRQKCRTIAYTYSEPTVWFEYMYDTAKLARKAGLKNLLITCGYINPQPLKDLSAYIDAANIDLKSFDENIYKKLNAGKLQPILDSIRLSRQYGIWVEITNLIVPEWTDSLDMIRKLCVWIRDTVGSETPLHFSRFLPMYKLAHLYPTPASVLSEANTIARQEGLSFVYTGNVAGQESDTICPRCKKIVIKRDGYLIIENNVVSGACRFCKQPIAGIWDA